ncbi:MAG TPA: hypothetical protein PLB05_06000 [Candidatus Omnitrophota bacterium]|nr:hypothetical protein [Candidatus Omnitrophota bacterium]HPN57481.1 hypothetical protein [Candidatus Omnitrophota bacterium]
MAKILLKVSTDKVRARLREFDELAMSGAEEGIGAALLQLKHDSIMERPTAPIDEGFLRGSASIFVQNKEVEQPEIPGEKTDFKLRTFSMSLEDSKIIGVLGFNVPYAARWHEVPANFQEPSAGNKYVETKMVLNRKIYKEIVINRIKKSLGII